LHGLHALFFGVIKPLAGVDGAAFSRSLSHSLELHSKAAAGGGGAGFLCFV